MQKCPHCEKMNTSKQTFCGSCGELIHIDPGFEKRVYLLLRKERKRSWAKMGSVIMITIGVASYFGHQWVTNFVAKSITKATPNVEAKIEGDLDRKVIQALPAMIARSEEREFPKVAKELKASHEKRMEDLKEAYERQARADEERFKASLAAAQPTLRAPASAYASVFPNASEMPIVSSTSALWSSTIKTTDTNILSYTPPSTPLTCCVGLVGSPTYGLENKVGIDCFAIATVISTSNPGASGSTVAESGGCKDRFILPKPADSPTGVIQPLWDPAKSMLKLDPKTGRLEYTSQQ